MNYIFDIDGTLTPGRLRIEPEFEAFFLKWMEGKEVYLVDLQDKDPSEMGFKNFTKLIQKTVPLTYYNLMEQKLAI